MGVKNDRGEYVSRKNAGLTTYEADWYSGSQIQVLMGDILIDNAVAISYQVNAGRIPMYGFGSEYFAFTAKAHTSITGNLVIAFKETDYLLEPAKRYHNRIQTQKQWHEEGKGVFFDTARKKRNHNPFQRETGFESLADASKAASKKRNTYTNVEQFLKNEDRKRPTSGLIKQIGAMSDSEFEHAAEVFEDVIWYGSNVNSPRSRDQLNKESLSNSAPEIDENEALSLRRLDQYPSVDITITYGDMEAPDTVNHTVQKLLDVHFVGESKQIAIGGDPILESYSFIARNRV